MHGRDEKSKGLWGLEAETLNLPQADACHPQPVALWVSRILSATLHSLLRSAMNPVAGGIAPLEMEKVEVATTAVTCPRSPHKVSFRPLISSHPAVLVFSVGGAGRPRSGKSCHQCHGFFAHCCYYIKKAAGEIMYAKVLWKSWNAHIIVGDNYYYCFIPRMWEEQWPGLLSDKVHEKAEKMGV